MSKEIIVIIGGPGTGKSTIIDGLVEKGFCCYPEISRQVTLEAKKEGIEQLFLKTLCFSVNYYWKAEKTIQKRFRRNPKYSFY